MVPYSPSYIGRWEITLSAHLLLLKLPPSRTTTESRLVRPVAFHDLFSLKCANDLHPSPKSIS